MNRILGNFDPPNYKLFFNNFHFIPNPSLFTCKPINCSYKYLLSPAPHTQKLGGHFENSFLTRHLMPTPIYMLLCFVLFPFSTFVLNYVCSKIQKENWISSDPFANSGSLGPDHLESTILKTHTNKQNLSSIHLPRACYFGK